MILQEELDELKGQSITLAAKKIAVSGRELKTSAERLLEASKANQAVVELMQREGDRVFDEAENLLYDVENAADYVEAEQFAAAEELVEKLYKRMNTIHDKVVTNSNKVFEYSVRVVGHLVDTDADINGLEALTLEAKKAASIVINASGVPASTEISLKFDRNTTALDTASNISVLAKKIEDEVLDFKGASASIELSITDTNNISVGLTEISAGLLSAVREASIILSGGSEPSEVQQTMNTVKESVKTLSGSAKTFVDGPIKNVAQSAKSIVSGSGASSSSASSIKSTSKDVAKTATMTVGKLMAKYKPDLPIHTSRPIAKGDTVWPTPPGSELPKEARAIANHEPTVRIWNKSAKGHTLHVDDQDNLEKLVITDRSGSVLLFDSPVKTTENVANKEQRGSRSVLTGDQLERNKMRDGGGKIILQDLAQSQLEFDSREEFEHITITANDGEGGIQNGNNRQKVEIVAGSNRIMIESVRDGKILARFTLDSNTGMITIEADTMISIVSPYTSITSEHINLNGRVCANGDVISSGRVTGGGD